MVFLDVTVGAASAPPPSQGAGGVAEFCGSGARVVKSVLLVSVSVHPPAPRRAAVVFDRPGAGPVPSKLLAVAP